MLSFFPGMYFEAKANNKKKMYWYFFLLTHIVLPNKRQVYNLDKWVLKKKGNAI